MGERLLCKQEVIGSIPFTSTKNPEEKRRGVWGRRGYGKIKKAAAVLKRAGVACRISSKRSLTIS